jgi:glycosyltransferase involved in cell wall biosynthesis
MGPPETARFALICPNYHPVTCGVGDNTMRLAAELHRRGHRAVVFTHAPASPHPETPDVPVHGVTDGGPMAVAAQLAEAISAKDFSHVVIEYTPQMWGASRFGSAAVPLLAASLRRRGIRVTAILHELFTPWQTRPDLVLGSALFRCQLGAFFLSCDHIFVTTDSRRRYVEAAVAALRPPRRLGTFRIGPGALPRPATPHRRKPRLGLFSTLAVGKSFDVVVSAFGHIADVYPDAELLLMGDLGPRRPALQALEAQIADTKLGDRIRLTGKLSLPEVSRLVASLDLYLFPMDTGANTRSSTLPLALGAGVPVVAVSGRDTDSLFAHGRNVYYADDLTGPAFARAALSVLADPALAARLAAGGRALFDEHLAWDRIVDAFLAAISDGTAEWTSQPNPVDRRSARD